MHEHVLRDFHKVRLRHVVLPMEYGKAFGTVMSYAQHIQSRPIEAPLHAPQRFHGENPVTIGPNGEMSLPQR